MGDRFGQEGRQPSRDLPGTSTHPQRDVDDGSDLSAPGTIDDHRPALGNSWRNRSGGISSDVGAAHSHNSKPPYEVHLQAPAPQQRPEGLRSTNATGHALTSYAMAQNQRPTTLNMGGMAGALPDYPSSAQPYGQQPNPPRFPSGPSTSALVYQLQQISQFAGQTAMSNPAYNPQYTQHYPGMYQQGQHAPQGASGYGQMHAAQQSHSGGPSPLQPHYPGSSYFSQHHQQQQQPQQQQQYLYYPTSYAQQIPGAQGMPGRAAPYPSGYGRRSSLSYGQGTTSHEGPDYSMANASFASQGGFPPAGVMPVGDPTGRHLRPGSVPRMSPVE